MPAKQLSDAFLRHVRLPNRIKGERQIAYIDTLERGLALVLVVSYGGTKAFRVMTYRDGKPQSRKLGTYPAMMVKEARAKAREYWQNPQRFEAQAQVGSFKEIAENWIKRHVEANRLRSQREIERILERYVYPRWSNRGFLEIRRSEVNQLLDQVADEHGISQADAVLAIIRGITTWHQSRDENYVSPIVRGMKRNKKGKSRDRVLDDDEIRALWKACDNAGAFGVMVKLLLLTAQRCKKVSTMKWGDMVDGVWTIPTDTREKGNAGKIKLPQIALNLIGGQARIAGNPYVFASGEKKHFNAWSQRKEELDEKLEGMKPWVLHDLRRTARSLMARADVRPDIAERVLGHAIAGVEGVYDRHHYETHKADALKRLAALIETIVNPPKGNVVSMTKQDAG